MRLLHIDITRGVCILLVVLGHNVVLNPEGGLLNQVLSTIRMPLMFFIAGTFFSHRTPLLELAVQKADALLKPFLVLALLQAPLRLTWGKVPTTDYISGVLMGGGSYLPSLLPLWFLPHLWLLFIFAWCVLNLLRKWRATQAETAMVTFGLLMLGVMATPLFWERNIFLHNESHQLLGLPMSADLLPISGFYFMTGVLARTPFQTLKFRWPTLLMSVLLFMLTMHIYNPSLSMLGRTYSHIFASTACALTGMMALIQISAALQHSGALGLWLAHCGVNSLLILLFHATIQNATLKLLALVPSLPLTAAGWLAFAAAVSGSLLLTQVIRRYAALGLLFLPRKQVLAGRAGRSKSGSADSMAQTAMVSIDEGTVQRADRQSAAA